MGLLKSMFGVEPKPFMEHPTGKFTNAVDAMEDAVIRLRKLQRWDQWITFCAQGEGAAPEDVEFAEVQMLGNKIDVGETALDVPEIISAAGTGPSTLSQDGAHYSVAAAQPRDVARILDAIFRQHFRLRPFADEGNDYPVGAEW